MGEHRRQIPCNVVRYTLSHIRGIRAFSLQLRIFVFEWSNKFESKFEELAEVLDVFSHFWKEYGSKMKKIYNCGPKTNLGWTSVWRFFSITHISELSFQP
jgi:hypothetical protein